MFPTGIGEFQKKNIIPEVNCIRILLEILFPDFMNRVGRKRWVGRIHCHSFHAILDWTHTPLSLADSQSAAVKRLGINLAKFRLPLSLCRNLNIIEQDRAQNKTKKRCCFCLCHYFISYDGFRAVSEQFQSNFSAVLEQYHICICSEKFQSSYRAVSEQYLSPCRNINIIEQIEQKKKNAVVSVYVIYDR